MEPTARDVYIAEHATNAKKEASSKSAIAKEGEKLRYQLLHLREDFEVELNYVG